MLPSHRAHRVSELIRNMNGFYHCVPECERELKEKKVGNNLFTIQSIGWSVIVVLSRVTPKKNGTALRYVETKC